MLVMNPFNTAQLRTIAADHGTPLWVYDAATIRERVASLKSFDVIRYARNQFQRACAAPHARQGVAGGRGLTRRDRARACRRLRQY